MHTALGIGHTGYADCLRAGSGSILIPLPVDVCTPDDGQRYCPKHVESYSKNKFEKFMLLMGFIIRISRC